MTQCHSVLVSLLPVASCSQDLAWQLLCALGRAATVARPASVLRKLLKLHKPPGAGSGLLPSGLAIWATSGVAAAAQPLCCLSAARPAGSLTKLLQMHSLVKAVHLHMPVFKTAAFRGRAIDILPGSCCML